MTATSPPPAPTGLSFKRLDLYAALNKVRPVTNTPPTLGTIANQTMTAGVPLVIPLSARDANGAPLTFSGSATTSGNSPAYQLGQQLGLSYGGSYFLDSMGKNEKWVRGGTSQWYVLLPNGELRRWMGNVTDTLAGGALAGSFDPAIYSDPSQFWTPSTTTSAPVTLTFSGSQLTVQCASTFTGSFTVVVAVSNGSAQASQSFTVNVNNRPLALSSIANQTMTAGVPLVIPLSVSNANGSLTFSGSATASGNSPVYQLGQQLGLSYGGSYFLNSMGKNEKWIRGTNSQWYCLMPNGELRRWMGNVTDTLAAGALVGSFGPAVYSDPSQFWTPPATTSPPVTLTFSGSQLTVQCPSTFTGSFTVVVTASNGLAAASQSFTVTANRPSVLGALANPTMAHTSKTVTVTVSTATKRSYRITV